MISLNSLAAFTQEVTRGAGIQPQRGPGNRELGLREAAAAPAQRMLETAPPPGSAAPGGQVLPRGSLLDLRV